MTLITPDMVTDACIETLKNKHTEHLAAFERQRGLAPKTIEPLQTIDLLVGEGFRLREDKPPAVLLGIFSTNGKPERDKDRKLTISWTLAAQIVAVGQGRADTIKRRDWYVMTVVECLVQRLPRKSEPVTKLELDDIDLLNGHTEEQRARTIGEGQILFTVEIRGAIDLNALPPENTEWPAGSPGGPPVSPYTPPVPPGKPSSVKTEVDKEPL